MKIRELFGFLRPVQTVRNIRPEIGEFIKKLNDLEFTDIKVDYEDGNVLLYHRGSPSFKFKLMRTHGYGFLRSADNSITLTRDEYVSANTVYEKYLSEKSLREEEASKKREEILLKKLRKHNEKLGLVIKP
jgi:hypothetical protein